MSSVFKKNHDADTQNMT